MANLDDTAADFPDIRQLEETDPVLGGVPNEGTGAGMDNIPHLQLARRTRWLKDKVDALLLGVGQAASTAVAGIVQLSDSVTSTATNRAATANAVKVAQDNANSRVPTTRLVTGGGMVSGGGVLNADRTLTVTAASSADANGGTREDVAMTPKSTKAVLDTRLAGIGALGIGQSWLDVKAARSGGVAYTNDTGKPIMVAISANHPGGAGRNIQISVDGSTWVTVGSISYNEFAEGVSFIVPATHHYRVDDTLGTIGFWSELR